MRAPIPGPAHCILAATDGSPAGDHAVKVIRQLVRSVAGLELVVITVRPPDRVPALAGHRTPLRGAVEAVASASEPTILSGHPSVEIVREAERRGASLIVIGRRPVEAAGTAMLGPTADQVVRQASVPCLVLPAARWPATPRILAAVDGSERGEGVFTRATAIARLLRGTVRSVTVRAAPQLNPAGNAVSGPLMIVRSGDPVDEVLAEARTGVDVLAVGIHRLGRPDSDLDRGIARRILRQATGPVLTIPL